jgi:hypothetical protein
MSFEDECFLAYMAFGIPHRGWRTLDFVTNTSSAETVCQYVGHTLSNGWKGETRRPFDKEVVTKTTRGVASLLDLRLQNCFPPENRTIRNEDEQNSAKKHGEVSTSPCWDRRFSF